MAINFIATPQSGPGPLLVTFSGIPDSRPDPTFSWNFGDSSTGSGQVVNHTYSGFGYFSPRLVIGPDVSGIYTYNTTFSWIDFWNNVNDYSGFYSSFAKIYNSGEWHLGQNNSPLSNVQEQVNIVTLSGNFRITSTWKVIGNDPGGDFGFYLSGVANSGNLLVEPYGESQSRLVSYYNGSILNTFNTSSLRTIQTRITKTNSGLVYEYIPNATGTVWSILTSGIYDLGNTVDLYFDIDGVYQGFKSILIEGNNLPESGSPYTDYSSWVYDDFEFNSSFFLESFFSGVYGLKDPEILYLSNITPVPLNEAVSNPLSGDYEFIAKVYTYTNNGGLKFLDPVETGYSFIIAHGDSNLGISFITPTGTISFGHYRNFGPTPLYWWARLAKHNVSGVNYLYAYAASGEANPTSGSWELISSVSGYEGGAQFSTSSGFNTLTLGFENSDISLGVNVLQVVSGDVFYSESLTKTNYIFVSGTIFDISGLASPVGFPSHDYDEHSGYYISSTIGARSFLYSDFQFNGGVTPDPGLRIPSDNVIPVFSNLRRYPYAVPGDTIQSRFELYKNGKVSYLSDLPVSIWFNFSGGWERWITGLTTNRYGTIPEIYQSTSPVPRINNGLGFARVEYNGNTYDSNLVRFNFIARSDIPSGLVDFFINAYSGDFNRFSFDIFNANSRTLGQNCHDDLTDGSLNSFWTGPSPIGSMNFSDFPLGGGIVSYRGISNFGQVIMSNNLTGKYDFNIESSIVFDTAGNCSGGIYAYNVADTYCYIGVENSGTYKTRLKIYDRGVERLNTYVNLVGSPNTNFYDVKLKRENGLVLGYYKRNIDSVWIEISGAAWTSVLKELRLNNQANTGYRYLNLDIYDYSITRDENLIIDRMY